jgi:hypothetical protein
MRLARVSLGVMGLTFVSLGAMSLVAPSHLTSLVEISMPSPIAVMEVRGVYGGLFFGIGVTFSLLAWRDEWLLPGLIAQAGIMGGFVLGRTVGIVVGGAPNLFISLLLLGEIFMATVALVLTKRLRDGRI